MNKNRRNILIAVVLLVILLVMPFWGSIKGLITGEDASTGATTEAPQVTCTLAVSVQPALEDIDLVKEEARDLLPEDGWLLAETQVTLCRRPAGRQGLPWRPAAATWKPSAACGPGTGATCPAGPTP